MSYYIKVLAEGGHEIVDHLLDLDEDNTQCSLQLTTVPGTQLLCLVVTDETGNTCLHVEIATGPEEEVELEFSRDGDAGIRLIQPRDRVFTLPVDGGTFLPRVLPPITEPTNWDIVWVVDGTMRVHNRISPTSAANTNSSWPVDSKFLLDESELWKPHVQRLCAFTRTLMAHDRDIANAWKGLRSGIILFGDQE